MILVTGATGFLGAHLVHQLSQNHKKVRALYRSQKRFEQVKEVFSYYTQDVEAVFDRIDWVECDINDVFRLNQIMDNITEVYHVAGLINFEWSELDRLKKINVEGTANIVNACLAHQIQKLFYVSSIAAIGQNTAEGTEDLSDGASETFEDPYALTKYGGEMEVWRGQQEGLDVLIIRPGVILGEGYWHSGSGKLIKHAAKRPLFYPMGGTGFIDVRDVVRHGIALMEGPAQNKAFIFVSHNAAFRQILDQLCDNFTQPKPQIKAPRSLLILASNIDFVLSKILRRPQKLPMAYVRAMFRASSYDKQTLVRTTGLPMQDIAHTLKRICSLSPYQT